MDLGRWMRGRHLVVLGLSLGGWWGCSAGAGSAAGGGSGEIVTAANAPAVNGNVAARGGAATVSGGVATTSDRDGTSTHSGAARDRDATTAIAAAGTVEHSQSPGYAGGAAASGNGNDGTLAAPAAGTVEHSQSPGYAGGAAAGGSGKDGTLAAPAAGTVEHSQSPGYAGGAAAGGSGSDGTLAAPAAGTVEHSRSPGYAGGAAAGGNGNDGTLAAPAAGTVEHSQSPGYAGGAAADGSGNDGTLAAPAAGTVEHSQSPGFGGRTGVRSQSPGDPRGSSPSPPAQGGEATGANVPSVYSGSENGRFAAGTVVGAGAASSSRLDVLAAWTELGDGKTVVARAVVRGGQCPPVAVNGVDQPMQARGSATAAFPVLSCSATLPAFARAVRVGRHDLALPKADIQRILVVGDTGCRLKPLPGRAPLIQACNDPRAWPFARIAQSAAQWQPDLVLHVGDYHYREMACPVGDSRCQGSFYGENWAAWQQDFFTPAKPLLAAAPWVFVRGNHESCARAGSGWWRFLAPGPLVEPCTDRSPSYQVDLGDHTLVVADSTDAAAVTASLRDLVLPAAKFVWLTEHRPLYSQGLDPHDDENPLAAPRVLQERGKISLAFAGHIHILSVDTFTDARPPEIISGNGGSLLMPASPGRGNHQVATVSVADHSARQYYGFGYLTLERQSESVWTVQAHADDGHVVVWCKLSESLGQKSEVTCK